MYKRWQTSSTICTSLTNEFKTYSQVKRQSGCKENGFSSLPLGNSELFNTSLKAILSGLTLLQTQKAQYYFSIGQSDKLEVCTIQTGKSTSQCSENEQICTLYL